MSFSCWSTRDCCTARRASDWPGRWSAIAPPIHTSASPIAAPTATPASESRRRSGGMTSVRLSQWPAIDARLWSRTAPATAPARPMSGVYAESRAREDVRRDARAEVGPGDEPEQREHALDEPAAEADESRETDDAEGDPVDARHAPTLAVSSASDRTSRGRRPGASPCPEVGSREDEREPEQYEHDFHGSKVAAGPRRDSGKATWAARGTPLQWRGLRGRSSVGQNAGLSRRRSRVRVPSLPFLEVPAFGQVALSHQTRVIDSWPKPVAQTSSTKCLQVGISARKLVAGRTNRMRSRTLRKAKNSPACRPSPRGLMRIR